MDGFGMLARGKPQERRLGGKSGQRPSAGTAPRATGSNPLAMRQEDGLPASSSVLTLTPMGRDECGPYLPLLFMVNVKNAPHPEIPDSVGS